MAGPRTVIRAGRRFTFENAGDNPAVFKETSPGVDKGPQFVEERPMEELPRSLRPFRQSAEFLRRSASVA
jgi:hypothetical protein